MFQSFNENNGLSGKIITYKNWWEKETGREKWPRNIPLKREIKFPGADIPTTKFFQIFKEQISFVTKLLLSIKVEKGSFLLGLPEK